jgi:spermidine synthase
LLVLFAITLGVSAALLFCVQPMIAKMILPLLGGTPSVWNTCIAFFQAMLLAGYVYSHLLRRLRLHHQIAVHASLLLIALAVLPVRIANEAVQSLRPDVDPSFWLLGVLFGSVGLPFFLGCTTSPLLQHWFANTRHPAAQDPYFLYAASNLGSLAGVLSFPVVIEPYVGLTNQAWLWSAGFVCLAILILVCGTMTWTSSARSALLYDDRAAALTSPTSAGGVTVGRRLRWLALASVASSLMLGLTTHITSDLASVPLFWVVPLAIYLLTFILVFSRRSPLPHAWMVWVLPFAAMLYACLTLLQATSVSSTMLHLVIFFVAAMVCHGELARDRPPAQYLTEFYLWLSAGGVLGGIFNAFIAPLIFDGIAEYPLALVCACLLSPPQLRPGQKEWRWWIALGLPLAIGAMTAGVVYGMTALGIDQSALSTVMLLGVLAILWVFAARRPVSFGLGIGSMLIVGWGVTAIGETVLYRERTYFSVLRVQRDAASNSILLIHGSTVHGQQSLAPDRRAEPLSYYHRTGPIGQVFAEVDSHLVKPSVAVVGLGAGSLAAYARPNHHWTFFEIDPAVERIAANPDYFTFLENCTAEKLKVILGDARLRLQTVPNDEYGLIILDAFSSDAIPVHLLTREAMRLYLSKLVDGGVLAFHISSRHLDLRPVLKGLAADSSLICRSRFDRVSLEEEDRTGKSTSAWVIMARRETDLGNLMRDRRWQPLRTGTVLWTDDHSNLWSVVRWD